MKNIKKLNYFEVDDLDYRDIINNLNFKVTKIKNSKIIISGGSGFIGKWLIGSLLNLNNIYKLNLKIYIISRNSKNFEKNYPFLKKEKSINFINLNLSKELLKTKKKFDYFFHLANDSNNKYYGDLNFQLNYNLQITRNIISFCEKNISKKIFFCSSGAADNILDIKKKLNFDNSYGIAKLISEQMFINNKKISNKIVIGRLYTFCGPLMSLKTHFAFNSFLNDVLNEKNIELKGNGETIRSYMYASILAVCILNLTLGKKYSQIVHEIGSTKKISILNLAKKIILASNSSSKIIIKNQIKKELKDIYLPKKDISKLLKFDIKVSIDHAIKKSFNYYKKLSKVF